MKEVSRLYGHDGGTWALAFAPSGKVLASAGFGVIKLWNVPGMSESESCSGVPHRIAGLDRITRAKGIAPLLR